MVIHDKKGQGRRSDPRMLRWVNIRGCRNVGRFVKVPVQHDYSINSENPFSVLSTLLARVKDFQLYIFYSGTKFKCKIY